MQEERLSAAYAEAREKRKPARIDDSGNLGRSSNDAFRQIAAVLADCVLAVSEYHPQPQCRTSFGRRQACLQRLKRRG